MEVKIELDNWWGNQSAYVKKGSSLDKLKTSVMDALTKKGFLTEKDMTDWNKTAHIKLTDNGKPRSQDAYDKVNNSIIKLSAKDIKINRNYIEIDTGHTGVLKSHMTFVYKNDIGRNGGLSQLVEGVYDDWVKEQTKN